MKSENTGKKSKQSESSIMRSWMMQIASMSSGQFLLSYDGELHCSFVSSSCLEVLMCGKEEFLDRLANLVVFTDYDAPRQSLDTLLRKMTASGGQSFFMSIVPDKEVILRYIGGLAEVSREADGRIFIYGSLTDLTATFSKEAYLRDLEQRHQAGLEMTSRVMYRYEIKGRRAIFLNSTASKMGKSEIVDDLPAWNVASKVIAPQSVDTWYAIFDAIDRGDKTGSADVLFHSKDGGVLRRIRVEFTSISDAEGNPEAAVVSHRDITDEYEMGQKQVLDRAGLLQVAQMAFPEIISVNLTKGTYRMIQYYGATTLGTPQEGTLDQLLLPRLEHVAPEDQEAFRNTFFREGQLKAIREGQERLQLTYRRRGQDGVWHWMETILIQQENPYDDDILTFGVSRNMDQQKKQEEMLRQALVTSSQKLEDWDYYHGLSDQAYPGLVYVNYRDGRPSPYVVGRLADKLGCPPKQLVLTTCYCIDSKEQDSIRMAQYRAELAGEKSFYTEYRVHTEDGEDAWVANRAVYFKDKNGDEGYIHFLSDITQEHHLTEQLRTHMEEKLKENQKIFHIAAQHSGRTLCYYDVKQMLARPWDEAECDTCQSPLCLKNFSLEQIEAGNTPILQESIEDAKQMLREIHAGKKNGEFHLHVHNEAGEPRWLHFKYTSLLNTEQQADAAIISFMDDTERYLLSNAYQK